MHAGLALHTSNRLDILADQLAEVLTAPIRSPLTPETVVVQSSGMRRWLTQQIAQRHGICSNVRFPFPQNFFHDLFQAAFPQAERTNVFDREAMTWRIMKLLPQFASRFAPIANYMVGERTELRACELARKIAHVFDQYLVFRPKMILDWDAGQGDDWQPRLWRELQRAAPGQHQAALGLQLVQALKNGAPVPERVSIFGVSTLPPFYVSLVDEISARCPVHLFIMEPTAEWWGDIRSKCEKVKQPDLFDFAAEQEPDNPLLAENGKLGRDFLNIIAELNPRVHNEQFILPLTDTKLHKIQRDIFELRSGAAAKKQGAAADDRSLQIHSCHSVVRELEVLHDQLLALFDDDPELNPRDIVVMMPDVSVYAPFVDAVFGVAENPRHKIPYTIADRASRASSGVTDIFLRVLELLPGRFGTTEVFAILESPAVQQRFKIEAADVAIIRRWVDQSAIRWGIDAEHRARLGLPAFTENSWRQGLDRMLLGCAMQPADRALFEGILPFDQIEGSNAQLLGNFIEFVERLFARAADFAIPRSLTVWQRDLLAAVDDFLEVGEPAQLELNQLRAALAELGNISAASENDDSVTLDVVVLQLEHFLDQASNGAGFLSGAITFCALKPMRSIPFKIVCLLGLNDTAYPRLDRAPGFDLIAQHRRPGDRNTRDDDRALFLEALLSARDVLYLSYIGQSMRDNSPLPPSVLVSELVEYIARRCVVSAEEIVVKHPLQAFSPRNFGTEDKRCFSYSLDNSAAGIIAGKSRLDPPPFFDQPLGEPEEEWREIEIAQLADFFSHPAKFFLRRRLGVDLPRERKEMEDREPFELHSLDGYAIEQQLLGDALGGSEPESALAMIRASGVLPPGGAGSLIFEELCTSVRAFADAIRHHVATGISPPMPIRAQIGDFILSGTLDRIRGDSLVHFRLATVKPKDFLRIWIEHLARNLSEQKSSRLFGKEKDKVAVYEFSPIDNALEILADLLALYWRGLREPLRFFPRSSWKFGEKLAVGKTEKDARFSAGKEWTGRETDGRGEQTDAYIKLAFRNTDEVLNQEWEQIARSIVLPIIEARKRQPL